MAFCLEYRFIAACIIQREIAMPMLSLDERVQAHRIVTPRSVADKSAKQLYLPPVFFRAFIVLLNGFLPGRASPSFCDLCLAWAHHFTKACDV